jgi:hypothetical protein
MNKDAVEAGACDAAKQHHNAKHQQSSQNAGMLRAFATLHICSVFRASAFQLSTGSRRARRCGAMHRRSAGLNHGLRGFALVLIQHVKKD